MQLPDMGVSGGPPDGACIVHHWMYELLIQQDPVPDGTLLLFRRGPNTPSLSAALFLTISLNRYQSTRSAMNQE
jgi:hypothetical protein